MFKTSQEEFWAGQFGNEYAERNVGNKLLAGKLGIWPKLLKSAHGVSSICEFGCNIGLNLKALSLVNPALELYGFDINANAVEEAKKSGLVNVNQKSIIEDINLTDKVNLTFTSGVLIHIAPEMLTQVYANLVKNSSKYIAVIEYYNPEPVEVKYRGHSERLFKRDFAGELMDQFDLKLVDYGFAYHRDNICPSDDNTWFLLEK